MCVALCVSRILLNGPAPCGGRIVQPVVPYTYTALKNSLQALQQQYPAALEVETIGYSREGRALYAARAGSRKAKHHVLIQAGIHAREHMTTLLVMAQLERLLRRGVPEGFCYHILPATNPDGAAISQTCAASAAIKAIYCDDREEDLTDLPLGEYLREWKANAVGVDLNRNFDAGWELIDTRPCPSFSNYRGTAPESEPETQALVSYTRRFPFDTTLSYHATGSEIYYDFGCNAPVNEAGLSLARAVQRRTRYKLVPDDFTSFGGYKDWAIQALCIPSLTIEIGVSPAPLPLSEYAAIWRKNRDVPFIVAKWVKHMKSKP